MLGVHRTTVANAYAELESEGLIQGHVGRGTFIKGNGNGLKITPPAPPVLNGNGGFGGNCSSPMNAGKRSSADSLPMCRKMRSLL